MCEQTKNSIKEGKFFLYIEWHLFKILLPLYLNIFCYCFTTSISSLLYKYTHRSIVISFSLYHRQKQDAGTSTKKSCFWCNKEKKCLETNNEDEKRRFCQTQFGKKDSFNFRSHTTKQRGTILLTKIQTIILLCFHNFQSKTFNNNILFVPVSFYKKACCRFQKYVCKWYQTHIRSPFWTI